MKAASGTTANAVDERQMASDADRARSYGEQQGKERRWLDRKGIQDYDAARGTTHQAVDKVPSVHERVPVGTSGNHERDSSGLSGNYERVTSCASVSHERQRIRHPRPDAQSRRCAPKQKKSKINAWWVLI